MSKKLKILLFGPSGSGKTRAALTFPRAAVVDAEGGTDLYAGRDDVPPFSVLRVKTLNELEDAIKYIEADNGKEFDTLVIDPVTVFYDVQKDAVARQTRDGAMGYREWAKVNNRMKALYTRLTNLPVHVVGIARESTEYDTDTSGNLRKVGVKADADKTLVYIFDFVIRMNPDHSGQVIKSRGQGLEGKLNQVNWEVFEPISTLYTKGQAVKQRAEDDAAEQLADDLRDRDTAKQFVLFWRNEGLDDSHLLAALGVNKISQWTKGRAAADAAIRAYVVQHSTPENGVVSQN